MTRFRIASNTFPSECSITIHLNSQRAEGRGHCLPPPPPPSSHFICIPRVMLSRSFQKCYRGVCFVLSTDYNCLSLKGSSCMPRYLWFLFYSVAFFCGFKFHSCIPESRPNDVPKISLIYLPAPRCYELTDVVWVTNCLSVKVSKLSLYIVYHPRW